MVAEASRAAHEEVEEANAAVVAVVDVVHNNTVGPAPTGRAPQKTKRTDHHATTGR